MPPLLLHIFLFLGSVFLLFWSGRLMIDSLIRIARFLGWKEFVAAFIVIALAASLPNLFLGISSALRRIPQLSFGDVVGGNVVDLTLAVALAALIAKGLPAESKLVQTSAIFTIGIALLPLLLIYDGILGRGDGILLLLAFFFYIFWVFSKKERYAKIYEKDDTPVIKSFKNFLTDLGKLVLGMLFLIAAAEGMVRTALFLADSFNLPLALIGIFIVGLSNSLPETYFAVLSASKGETWMILGDLMGSVIVAATLVLGIVALIYPIEITNFSPFAIARIFLIMLSTIFFFLFVRTERKITRKEGIFLLTIYILFLVFEIVASRGQLYQFCLEGLDKCF